MLFNMLLTQDACKYQIRVPLVTYLLKSKIYLSAELSLSIYSDICFKYQNDGEKWNRPGMVCYS